MEVDVNNDGKITDLDRVLIDGTYCLMSGRGNNEMIKTPAIIKGDGVEFKYTSGSSGSLGVITAFGE
ncbi:MAG: type IV pilus assembly protein PilY1 [Zhongshania sp.]|jgi:type IV pilus assembly protein PilY1